MLRALLLLLLITALVTAADEDVTPTDHLAHPAEAAANAPDAANNVMLVLTKGTEAGEDLFPIKISMHPIKSQALLLTTGEKHDGLVTLRGEKTLAPAEKDVYSHKNNFYDDEVHWTSALRAVKSRAHMLPDGKLVAYMITLRSDIARNVEAAPILQHIKIRLGESAKLTPVHQTHPLETAQETGKPPWMKSATDIKLKGYLS